MLVGVIKYGIMHIRFDMHVRAESTYNGRYKRWIKCVWFFLDQVKIKAKLNQSFWFFTDDKKWRNYIINCLLAESLKKIKCVKNTFLSEKAIQIVGFTKTFKLK